MTLFCVLGTLPQLLRESFHQGCCKLESWKHQSYLLFSFKLFQSFPYPPSIKMPSTELVWHFGSPSGIGTFVPHPPQSKFCPKEPELTQHIVPCSRPTKMAQGIHLLSVLRNQFQCDGSSAVLPSTRLRFTGETRRFHQGYSVPTATYQHLHCSRI